MIALLLIMLAPATGGALILHLWQTRPRAAVHAGLAIGQVPVTRHRHHMAIRRERSA